jgi:6-phosphogluconolactonase
MLAVVDVACICLLCSKQYLRWIRRKRMTSSQQTVYSSGYVSADQPGIHAFTFDATNGTLTPRGSYAGIAAPSFLIAHPNGRWLYAVSETSQQNGQPGTIWAMRVTESWSIEPLNKQASGGDWPCHLVIDATGRWLIASNYASGSVGVLPILDDGSLGAMTDLIQHRGSGPHPDRQEGPHAHSATFTPDQRFVIIADLGIDALRVYAFDSTAGKLREQTTTATRPGAGPRHLAFHPNGKHVFVSNELNNTVAVYSYDAASGTLSEQQSVSTLPSGAPENAVADIHVSPTGDRVYVSNRGHDSIAIFQIGSDGQLTPVAIRSCGGCCPRNFAIEPGNHFLLVANQESNEVAVLPVQDAPEAIGAAISRVAVKGASCVQFAPSNS